MSSPKKKMKFWKSLQFAVVFNNLVLKKDE